LEIIIENCKLKNSKLMKPQKQRILFFSSFPRKRESRKFKYLWTPAFAGVTPFLTFYETIKIENSKLKVFYA